MRYENNLQKPDFTVENIDILTIIRGKDYRHSYRNGRTKHGFIYIVRGTMDYEFLSKPLKNISLQQGDLIFIPKATAYEGVYRADDTCIRIVQFDLRDGALPGYLQQPTKLELPNGAELIESFFKRLNGHVFYHMSCLYSLLWQTCASLTEPPAKFKRLQSALTRMAEHPEENKKIDFYAGLCGMSEVNFRRLFGQYTGKSPVEYRNDIRLHNARILLQSGEYNVSEAAERWGFSNLSYFIRLYRQAYGHTPKKL